MGQRYANPRELLQRVAQTRRDHSSIRCRVAKEQCLALAYASGRHWAEMGVDRRTGDATVTQWDEDWSLRSSEMRVTDNRIGPLLRQMRASTNAAAVRAKVKPLEHDRGARFTDIARSAEMVLNGIEPVAGMTKAYRRASSLRWAAGSSLLVLQSVRKTAQMRPEVVVNPDGTPVSIDDSWVRWTRALLSDLIWDPQNTSPDLDDHEFLVLEQVKTLTSFEREFGPVERWGVDRRMLPQVGQIAPHYVSAASVAGSSIYGAYAAASSQPGLRLLTVLECGPDSAPGRFPCCWQVIDTTSSPTGVDDTNGIVMDWDNPYGKWGDVGRPVFKFDAFRRDDRVDAVGVPGVLMTHNDLLNIARSIQFQQMVAVVHGSWLVDRRAANRDEFINQLNSGVGGVLSYDSRDGAVPPPQFVQPPPPDQTWPIIVADMAQTMMSAVHQTQQSLGVAKSHVPQDVQLALLQQSGVVVDQVVLDDGAELAVALRVTLGTTQRSIASGGGVLGHLRDNHGFDRTDVLNVLDIDPDRIGLEVRAVPSDLVARGSDQRAAEINNAMLVGHITPAQASIALASELGRPVIRQHAEMVDFSNSAIRMIVDGQDWPGLPSLPADVFAECVQLAIYRMRLPQDAEAILRLQQAVQLQNAIARENPELQSPQSAMSAGGRSQAASGSGGGGQGAPASIDPRASPIGAAGGLPLGLPASIV